MFQIMERQWWLHNVQKLKYLKKRWNNWFQTRDDYSQGVINCVIPIWSVSVQKLQKGKHPVLET